jgi:uncharacterized protein
MSVAIVVMAKAPVAGLAKTRLAPALGAEGAAALAQRLLVHATEQAVAAGIGPVELCVAPDTTHEVFAALQQRFGLSLHPQGDGDLGTRMHRAFVRHGGPMLLVGSDIPALDATLLRRAATLLATHDAVVVPAHDGGYALVGLRAPCAALFEGMHWSVPTVMAATRERLRAAGLRHAELPAVHDIDLPADLVHLPPSLAVTPAIGAFRENTP